MSQPLADLIRPTTLDDMVGQTHLLGKNCVLRKLIESKNIPNLIFYGPSGTGKTTLAGIIAKIVDKKLYKINATSASTGDVKEIISKIGTLDSEKGILLYIDEIQYFSKKQQQLLLEYIESGDITLICSTTENPYFYIYNALISRSTIFEFKPINRYEIEKAINRALKILSNQLNSKIDLEEGLVNYLATICGGDCRKAINSIEILINICNHYDQTYFLTMNEAKQIGQRSALRYDKDGDEHYDLLSAFQKSIRGSNPDAGVFYLAKLLASNDLISPCRRLLVIASEDIGLAYPLASSIVKSLVDTAMQLGLPEARIPLAEAVIFLATCPKSNSAIMAIDKALEVAQSGKGSQIPTNLLDTHYQGSAKLGHGLGYVYPHNYKNHYVKQQYLPDDLENEKFYQFQDNKVESAAKKYWDEIKK